MVGRNRSSEGRICEPRGNDLVARIDDRTDHHRQVGFPEEFYEFQTMLQAERHTKRTREIRFKKRELPSNGPSGQNAHTLRRRYPLCQAHRSCCRWICFALHAERQPPTANRQPLSPLNTGSSNLAVSFPRDTCR
jgi:hypothetical protein